MQREYAEMRNDAYYVTGSCVSGLRHLRVSGWSCGGDDPAEFLDFVPGADPRRTSLLSRVIRRRPSDVSATWRRSGRHWSATPYTRQPELPAPDQAKTESSCWRNRRENSVDADLKHATVAGTLRCADKMATGGVRVGKAVDPGGAGQRRRGSPRLARRGPVLQLRLIRRRGQSAIPSAGNGRPCKL